MAGDTGGTITGGGTFTLRNYQVIGNSNDGLEDKNVSSTGAQSCDFTMPGGSNWWAECATFKAASAAATTALVGGTGKVGGTAVIK